MELETCINFILTRAQNSVLQLFKAELAPYGVTPGQYGVLQCLWDENGLTAKQLAERLFLDSSTITGILDRLENKAMIVREQDSRDRRAICVSLTPKGKELEKPIGKVIEEANHKALHHLDEKEAAALKRLLNTINPGT